LKDEQDERRGEEKEKEKRGANKHCQQTETLSRLQ
jgi:hypothetical protein